MGRNGKAPRTVHIDVYCTGSDGDSGSSSREDSLSSSSSSDPSFGEYHPTSASNVIECASNSTHHTVYESQAMKLKHKRVEKEDLPRKYLIDKSTSRGNISSNSHVPSRGVFISFIVLC